MSAADTVGRDLATAMEDWADSRVHVSLELSQMMEAAGVTLADATQVKDAFLVAMDRYMDEWLAEIRMSVEG